MIKNINISVLQRYVEMRDKVDNEAETIQSLSSMLALLQYCGDDRVKMDPVALGKIHSMIETSILNIWEFLDDFIYIIEARQVLERKK